MRDSGTCGQVRLEQPYAEECLLEFSASGPIWADDVHPQEDTIHRFL